MRSYLLLRAPLLTVPLGLTEIYTLRVGAGYQRNQIRGETAPFPNIVPLKASHQHLQ